VNVKAAVMGYADRQSVRPGEPIEFKVSSVGPQTYRVDIVRLIAPEVGLGDDCPDFKEIELDTPVCSDYPTEWQPIHPGSAVRVPLSDGLPLRKGITLSANVFPTLLSAGRQGIVGTYCATDDSGVSLILEDGALALAVGRGDSTAIVTSSISVIEHRWTAVAVTYEPGTGTVEFHAAGLERQRLEVELSSRERLEEAAPGSTGSGNLYIGAARAVDDRGVEHTDACFNGRIERPRVYARTLDREDIGALSAVAGPTAVEDAFADWDFSIGIDTESVTDVSGNGRHGETVNLPSRAVGGSNWAGQTDNWQQGTEQYGAIHFHDDDVDDARWCTTFTLVVPDDWRSGCYAARLRADDAEFYVPFVVRAASGKESDVVLLLSTATYGAYANLRLRVVFPWNELIHGRLTVLDDTDLLMLRFPEIGGSTYDSHTDGSTVVYSSMRRPVTNFRPKGRIYKFCQDLLLVSWLEEDGYDFDVITDEDVHREGLAALEPYRVVISSSHPEYTSTEMFDATEEHVRQGGRMMYLGGNGWYWRIGYHPTRSGIVEVRRPDAPRLWAADVSQGHLSFSGERAGTWSWAGRPPQTFLGVGFITQGFDECSYYRRTVASNDERAAFIFQGVDDELIGDFGLLMGGAAGYEIDRADALMGTPRHALVLASSEGHSNLYDLMVTSLVDSLPPTNPDDPDRIRADMVFYESPGGGAVFSVGSIAWSGSLSHARYDNNVAAVSRNVLNRFLDPQPFRMPSE